MGKVYCFGRLEELNGYGVGVVFQGLLCGDDELVVEGEGEGMFFASACDENAGGTAFDVVAVIYKVDCSAYYVAFFVRLLFHQAAETGLYFRCHPGEAFYVVYGVHGWVSMVSVVMRMS